MRVSISLGTGFVGTTKVIIRLGNSIGPSSLSRAMASGTPLSGALDDVGIHIALAAADHLAHRKGWKTGINQRAFGGVHLVHADNGDDLFHKDQASLTPALTV